MRTIESYASDGATVVLNGRTHPVPSLIEDDEDGIRWLLLDNRCYIHAPLWARASAAGAAGLMHSDEEEYGQILAMTAERFAQDRTESAPNYVVDMMSWSLFDHVPVYTEVYSAPRNTLVKHPVAANRTGIVHGHVHAEYSSLDGLSTVPELVAEAVRDGQPGLALTDHGRCSGHPQLQAECDKAGIKPIFGIEAYFVNDRHLRGSDIEAPQGEYTKKGKPLTAAQKVLNDYCHLILWAMNEEGLENLWSMSTESFRDGFYGHPRMDWDTLRRHSGGIMAASGCLRGPLSVSILKDDEETARADLGKMLDIFGDRFYLEIQPNVLAEQEKVNRALVSMGKEFGVPLMATVDSHYPTQADHAAHQAWIALQIHKSSDEEDEGDLFSVNLDLYMQSEADVRKGLAYLGADAVDEAVKNTLDLVTRTDARIGGKPTAPVYSKQGGTDRDVERLLDLCISNWDKIGSKPDQDGYMARFEREFALLRSKGFCGYFLMVSDYCRHAKQNGILVGPGRGSGAGSLVAYLSDITEVDPIEARLPFERFMTEGRVSLPDFDVDFPASKKEVMLQYLADKYGADHVIQIGTHLRLKSKGIVQNLGRAMMDELVSSSLPDFDWTDTDRAREARAARQTEIQRDLVIVSKIIEGAEAGTAGLGMAWDDLWAQWGEDLGPYRQKYPKLFAMADKLVGRLKSYGKHSAGVVISTDRPLTGWLPLMGGEDGRMISQFDMNALEQMGLVKFDVLTIRTLDTIQMAVDLIRDQRQVEVEVYRWTEEYADPAVWKEISRGNTLGMFQIETKAGTRLATRMKPRSMTELADMNTIVRPGPMRSGLTETYLQRRAGLETVTYADSRMEEILGDSQGAPIYQDHVLQLLMTLAGYSSDEADEVRKILGKKKVEKIGPAGQEFVHRAREWGGMERDVAQHLWDQLAEFAKYGFNKAHAYSYSMISYWTAWLKIHYPIEFFVAALSTIDKDRIPEFIKEVRRHGYTVLPPDINASGKGFKAEPLAVRYGLDAIKGIGDVAVDYLIAGQVYTSYHQFDEYVTQKGTKANAGVQMLLARIGALDSLEPRRAGLVALLEARTTGEDTRCVHKRDDVRYTVPLEMEEGETAEDFAERKTKERAKLPPDFCTFDWSTEPQPVNARTGKLLPLKPLPKKCTRACRMHTAPAPVDHLAVAGEFQDEDIRAIEHDLLGVFLSSTPFDKIPADDRKTYCEDAERLVTGDPGFYTVAAILMSVRKTKTRASQEEMAFLSLDTEVATLEAVVFPRTWTDIQTGMHTGQLCLAVLEKQDGDRGLVVREYLPVNR